MNKGRTLRLTSAFVLASMAFAPGFSTAAVQEEQGAALVATTPPTQPALVRLYVNDRDHLNKVAGQLDIWETHPDELYVVAHVTPEQYAWLERLGYRMEVDATTTAQIAAAVSLDPRFHYFDDYYTNANGLYVVDFLQNVNADYPELTELHDIGDAWQTTQPGQHHRDIWVLRITNEDAAFGAVEDKPAFFLMATIHAREVAVPELAIRYIKYLTEGYDGGGGHGVDPDVTWLVDHHVAYVLVVQNPDGHAVNEFDREQFRRKNLDSDGGCPTERYLGVDLNRNHSFLWNCCGGSDSDPCSETYRGTAPASEPETQAFQAYFASVMQDQNGPNGDNEIAPAAPPDTTGIFITLHAYSDLVLWPWGFDTHGPSPNFAQLETIGRKFSYFNGYAPDGTIWYDVDGATDDWTYGKFGIASFTIEVGPRIGDCRLFFPPYGCIDGLDGMPRNFWAENRPALLYAHQIARTPYQTAYGPDTSAVLAALTPVRQGTLVPLTALGRDHRLTGDPVGPIGGAEYFVDTPGADGAGTPMATTDGTWGGLTEFLTASVDTAALASGQHYILVHSQNDSGYWGPFTATFLDVWTPGDFDDDGDVDRDDYPGFASCLSGPGQTTPPDGCSPHEFDKGDLDEDLDADLSDFAALQAILEG